MSNKRIYGYVSLLYSVADKPLGLWSKQVSLGGKIRRVCDDMLYGDKVIEIIGPHDSIVPTNLIAPARIMDVLNIKLPVLILIIKNLKLRFKLDIQVTDKEQHRRKFSFMTYNLEKLPSVNTSMACIPLTLAECWNMLEVNLQTICHTVYGTDYEALQKVIVYPNCRLRRIYLQDCHYNYDKTPIELCNAFFDTNMLKGELNPIEELPNQKVLNRFHVFHCMYRVYMYWYLFVLRLVGLIEQYDLNHNSKITMSLPTKIDLSANVYNVDKLKKFEYVQHYHKFTIS